MSVNYIKKYEELKPIVMKIIKLANAYEEYVINGPSSISSSDYESFEKAKEYHLNSKPLNELEKIFKSLSDNEIMLIQTLMYIGRDKSKDIDYDSVNKVISQELKILGFEFNSEIDKRDVEISQMTSKVPLGKYLKSGLKKIKV